MPIITFETNKPNFPGFTNGKLNVKCDFGESLDSVINKLNEFRSPSAKIENLITFNNKRILKSDWGIKIKENYTFLIE
jgi:hypothetical protein